MALHCARQTDAEWLRRELQRAPARRMPQRASVRQPQRGARDHRRLEDRLQHQPTAFEPQRAHTNRVRSTPQSGAKLEQTLLITEGKLGSRSYCLRLWWTANRGYSCKPSYTLLSSVAN